jgi:hypothetical protein
MLLLFYYFRQGLGMVVRFASKPDWPALACHDSEGFTFVTVHAERELYPLKAKLR